MPISKLRGASRLAHNAVLGLTDLVEAMHGGIARVPGAAASERTRGITGLVYRSVRGVTGLVGEGVDQALMRLAPVLRESDERSETGEALLAALNGVFGDYLAENGSPLAIPMRIHRSGDEACGPRPLLLIHGLCMNDLQWQRGGFAERFAALGYTPIHLHYNSGRHISENGKELATLLEEALAAWPVPVKQLTLLGHSMGGLLARSAVLHADGMKWPKKLKRLITLGTPHFGAPLEQGGAVVEKLLGISAYSRPFAALAQRRSAGIQDLRWASLREQDWGRRGDIPLPADIASYAAAGSSTRLAGDGLVTVNSALGRHRDASRRLLFQDTAVFAGVDHMGLQTDAAVLAQIIEWLS